jgi:excinuclease UvrABC ATPase subunit
MHNSTIIKGAREHNLKNIDVTIPHDRFVVTIAWIGREKRDHSPNKVRLATI